MADADTTPDNHGAAPAKAKGSMLPWLAVGVVSAGLGAAVPIALSTMGSQSSHGSESAHGGGHAAGHGGGHGGGHDKKAASDSKMAIVPYGDVYTNLNDGRMNRYLRISLSLHVRSEDEELVKKAVASKNLIIRDWLINHLSDKGLEDVRGKAGSNMLRREIRDYFNTTLFSDSYDRIYEVLITEFAIQ